MPTLTAPSRASLVAGIGKVSRAASSGTYVSQAESEFTINLREKLSPVRIGGQTIDQRWIEYVAELSFTPDGRLTAPSLLLFWNDFNNLLPGQSIYGTTDVNTVVTGSDGAVHTLFASAVTSIPSIILRPERGAIGPTTITGIIGSALDWTASSSFYGLTGAGTFTDATWVSSDALRQQYSASYGAVAGLTDFQMVDGWTIDFRLGVAPTVVQGITRDMKFTSLEVMARGIPTAATTSQILQALLAMASSGTAGHASQITGRSHFSNAVALTITGQDGTAHVTIPKASIYTGQFTFSGERLRVGEVAFYACRNYSSGAQQALYTIA